jgi:DNA-binding MarR family transcriptional regulator
VPKATTLHRAAPRGEGQGRSVDRIEVGLQTVARAITQVRLHERLLLAAGVRLDRAGAYLLHKLHLGRTPQRVTDLAEQLGVDAPTVTRKIQQLEREGLVERHPDPADRRASRIQLTPSGKKMIERIEKARRSWLERLLQDWDPADLEVFGVLLGRFSESLAREMEDGRGN